MLFLSVEICKMKVVALVPVRSGSVGLPGKNTRMMAGVPLYKRAIRQALDSGFDSVVVSTDDNSILESPILNETVFFHKRPAALSTSDASMDSVVVDALKLQVFDEVIFVLLQATSPLRRIDDIKCALDMFIKLKPGLLMSVCKADSNVLKYGTIDTRGRFFGFRNQKDAFTNRQKLPRVFCPNGAIYIALSSDLRERGQLATDDIVAYQMNAEDSLDIDQLSDFEFCEKILIGRERV